MVEGQRDERVAMGADTLLGVLREAAHDGFGSHFTAVAPGRVHCDACDRRLRPRDLDVVRLRRLEGASDVADMLLVAWCECPACRTRGVLTLGYGPNAADPDVEVLAGIDVSGVER